LPESIYVKSISYGGKGFTHAPIELAGGGGSLDVVLSAKTSSVSGSLRNEKNEPLTGVTVTVWPKALNLASASLGAKSATSDQNGEFQVTGLPPDDYYAAAWEGEPLNSGVIQIPELLTYFASEASAVTLPESSQASVDPKMISAAKITAQLAKLP
jgi:hypothetical protein